MNEGHYKAGVKDGIFRYYGCDYNKKTEIIERELPFKDGKLDGIIKSYFRDGTVESEKEYRNGLEHGRERFYDSRTR